MIFAMNSIFLIRTQHKVPERDFCRHVTDPDADGKNFIQAAGSVPTQELVSHSRRSSAYWYSLPQAPLKKMLSRNTASRSMRYVLKAQIENDMHKRQNKPLHINDSCDVHPGLPKRLATVLGCAFRRCEPVTESNAKGKRRQ